MEKKCECGLQGIVDWLNGFMPKECGGSFPAPKRMLFLDAEKTEETHPDLIKAIEKQIVSEGVKELLAAQIKELRETIAAKDAEIAKLKEPMKLGDSFRLSLGTNGEVAEVVIDNIRIEYDPMALGSPVQMTAQGLYRRAKPPVTRHAYYKAPDSTEVKLHVKGKAPHGWTRVSQLEFDEKGRVLKPEVKG